MQISRWKIILGIILVVLSATSYFIHYLIFRDAHHIFIYLVGDIAFVFVEVLLVTMIIDGVLHYREKRVMLEKLNMVIGSFFSECGNEILKCFIAFDPQREKIGQDVIVRDNWTAKEFFDVSKMLKGYDYPVDLHRGDIDALRGLLAGQREFLLRLLENPSLLEHESFTNLMMSLFHLTEELAARQNISQLSAQDQKHITADIKRAYRYLVSEWLSYMKHLQDHYPYLFSFATRTNPFDPHAKVEIQ
ncbi:MAG: hypothetical protein JW943_13260 [Deltaproteobacteria bacterium]|nr:hypothetical protein [Deltaproteobacteria bacterium]